ncbi:MAG TPA: hypothetical protein VMZ33_05760 [Candidatus Limnocylindrales bacterium]|nr:hypothetical protein [Candidatus Limnocylindrales bacterium]
MSDIALVTCSRLPELDPDDRPLIEHLGRRGHSAVPATWDDLEVDWKRFAVVVLRNPWDYTDRRDEFVAWAKSVASLLNPADVVEWNTDKRYLGDLARAGVPIVPTTWIEPGDVVRLPDEGRHVLKPSVGAGSLDAAAFSLHDIREQQLARDHAQRLLATSQTVMLQPYLDLIEERGETGLIYMGGEFSHAIGKGPMLVRQTKVEGDALYKEEVITAREALADELEVGRQALEAVPGGSARLLYARVDMVPGPDGSPLLMELELTEPSLFMSTTPGTVERFADAIAARALVGSRQT